VVSTYKDMIFIPVETSGEGDVNAHSRVQMPWVKRKFAPRTKSSACLMRLARLLRKYGPLCKSIRKCSRHIQIWAQEGLVGVAANFVAHAAERIKAESRVMVAVN